MEPQNPLETMVFVAPHPIELRERKDDGTLALQSDTDLFDQVFLRKSRRVHRYQILRIRKPANVGFIFPTPLVGTWNELVQRLRKSKRVITLHIPDEFVFMGDDLSDEIRAKLAEHLSLPDAG